MTPAAWPERLQWLVARFPELGVGADLAELSAADLWGLYRFLSRIADST
jgi:hypothetical protein